MARAPTDIDPRPGFSQIARSIRAAVSRKWSVPEIILVVAVVAFITLASVVSVARFLAFDLRGYDFGIYTAAAVDVVRLGATPVFPHFSPILYAVAPLVWVFPTPTTLLVLEAVAIGAMAFPMFWLGRARLGSEWGSLVAVLALLFGFIPLALDWSGFAVECFLPVAFLAALYARERAHLVGFLLALTFALLATETALPFVAALGLFTVVRWAWRRRQGTTRSADLALGSSALALSGAWLGLLFLLPVLEPGANSGSSTYFASGYAVGWWHLGASSPVGVLPAIIFEPVAAGQQLLAASPSAGLFLLLLLGAFGFLAVLGPLDELLLALAWPVLAFFSSVPADGSFGNAFVAYSLPFMAAAALGGAARLARWVDHRPTSRAEAEPVRPRPLRARRGLWIALTALVVGAVATTAVATPFLPQPLDATAAGVYGWPDATAHDHYLFEVLDLLPPDASVLTTNGIYPLVSADPHARCAPISPFTDAGQSFAQVLQGEINASTFVVLDYVMDWENTLLVVTFGNLSGFHLVAAANGVRLLERGPAPAALSLFVGESWTLPIDALVPVYGTVESAADGADVIAGGPGLPDGYFVWVGPYLSDLPPGIYEAWATYTVTTPTPTTPVEVQVVDDAVTVEPVVLATNHGEAYIDFEFQTAGGPQTVLAEQSPATPSGTSTFTVGLRYSWNGTGVLEFPGKLIDPAASIILEGISFEVVVPLP